MLETSQFLGTHRYEESADLQARIGYTDPPTHVSTFTGIGGYDETTGQVEVFVDTHATVAREWAERVYASVRADSAPIQPDRHGA